MSEHCLAWNQTEKTTRRNGTVSRAFVARRSLCRNQLELDLVDRSGEGERALAVIVRRHRGDRVTADLERLQAVTLDVWLSLPSPAALPLTKSFNVPPPVFEPSGVNSVLIVTLPTGRASVPAIFTFAISKSVEAKLTFPPWAYSDQPVENSPGAGDHPLGALLRDDDFGRDGVAQREEQWADRLGQADIVAIVGPALPGLAGDPVPRVEPGAVRRSIPRGLRRAAARRTSSASPGRRLVAPSAFRIGCGLIVGLAEVLVHVVQLPRGLLKSPSRPPVSQGTPNRLHATQPSW